MGPMSVTFYMLITGQVQVFVGSSTSGTADGIGTNARFISPAQLAMDSTGVFYLADHLNYRIRKISSNGNEVADVYLLW